MLHEIKPIQKEMKAQKPTERQKLPVKLLLRKAKLIRDKVTGKKEETEKEIEDPEDDIDAIFSNIKKTKKEKAARDAALKEAQANAKQPRRYTEDGLPIYTEAELKLDNPKAGTTPLCPFDCDCCF